RTGLGLRLETRRRVAGPEVAPPVPAALVHTGAPRHARPEEVPLQRSVPRVTRALHPDDLRPPRRRAPPVADLLLDSGVFGVPDVRRVRVRPATPQPGVDL